MEQPRFTPNGKIHDIFDQDAHGVYQSDLNNLAYDKHLAQRRNLIYLALVVLCVAACVYISTTANYKTYVVRVDNATGQVEAGNQLVATNYSPKEAEIKYFLSEFVRATRTLPLDPILYKQNWTKSQHYMTQAASQKYNRMISEENQLARLGRTTTQVKIRSLQKQPGSERTFQVRWSETEYNIGGSLTGKEEYYVALFTVLINPPTREEELLINPLGLTIADLNYAREAAGSQ